LTSGKTDASFLEQFGFRELTPCRLLTTDHSNQTEVGSDESLPSLRSLVLKHSQFLISRVGKSGTRHPGIPRQQASFNRALQINDLGAGKQRFGWFVIEGFSHADTVEQSYPPATPGCTKSVDICFTPLMRTTYE
jgi:hypothetical protein